MLRNVFLMVLCVGLLVACNEPAPVQPKIGVVDTTRVYRESETAKKGVLFLEELQKEVQEELMGLQEQIKADPENVSLQEKAQNIYLEFQQRFGAEEQNVINILQDALLRSVEGARVSAKLDIVIDAGATQAYDKSIDLTDAVIAELNKLTVDFKAIVPVEEVKPAEAPAAETPAEAAAPEAEKTETPAAEATPEAEKTEAPAEEAAPEAEKTEAPAEDAAPEAEKTEAPAE